MSGIRLGLGKKLLLGYMIDAGFAVGVCAASIYLFLEIKDSLTSITSGKIPVLQAISEAGQESRSISTLVLDIKNERDPRQIDHLLLQLKQKWEKISSDISRYSPGVFKFSGKMDQVNFSEELDAISQITGDISVLNLVLSDKIKVTKGREEAFRELIASREEFNKDFIRPALENSGKYIKTTTRNLAKNSSSATDINSLVYHLKSNDLILALNESGQELFSLVFDSISTVDLSTLNKNIRSSLQEIRRFKNHLEDLGPKDQLVPAEWIKRVELILIGPGSFISLRRREIRLDHTTSGMLQRHSQMARILDEKTTVAFSLIEKEIVRSGENLENKIRKHSQQLIFATLTGVFLVFFIMVIYIGKRLVIPLLATSQAMLRIAEGREDTTLPKISSDEIGDVVGALTRLKKYVAQVRDLAEKLASRSADVNNMLQNTKQGIFTVTGSGKIHHEYSKNLEVMLEENDLAGKDAVKILFDNSDIIPEKKEQLKASLLLSVGNTVFSFKLNRHLFLTEISRRTEARQRTFEIDWLPVVDSKNIVEKIMVNVRDVTEVREARKEAVKHRKESEVMVQILSHKNRDTGKFLKWLKSEARSLLKALSEESGAFLSRAFSEEVFRRVHTMKGSARQFGFSMISSDLHLFEDRLNMINNSENLNENPKNMARYFSIPYRTILLYHTVYFRKIQIHSAFVDRRLDILRKSRIEAGLIRPEEMNHPRVKNLVKRLLASDYYYESDFKLLMENDARLISQKLGKPEPQVHLKLLGFSVIEEEFAEKIRNLLVHMISNSLVHGIESPGQRTRVGKPVHGSLMTHISQENDCLIIEYRDDGQGVDPSEIREKYREKFKDSREYSDSEALSLIFAFGFSTADQLTEISGRGVGLSSVLKDVESNGGSCSVRYLDERNAKGNRRSVAFTLRLHHPVILMPSVSGSDTYAEGKRR